MKSFDDVLDEFWHKTLRRPYKLSVMFDEGAGTPVIFIHGLGSSSAIWLPVIKLIDKRSYRVIAIDLLGFGSSPKPAWPAYSVDDHAKALIASMDRVRLSNPPILVGHSMGCLVAVRIARLRPDLAAHLILFEMPLYEGLPEKRIYRLRLKVYQVLYSRIASYEPDFTSSEVPLIQRFGSLITGFGITKNTWPPFRNSLKNTIMKQSANEDMKHIGATMDVIYGRRDMLVIRGKPIKIFGKDSADNIKSYTINAAHSIPKSAGKFIAARIEDAAEKNDNGSQMHDYQI